LTNNISIDYCLLIDDIQMLDRDHALNDMHSCVAVGPFEVSFNTLHKRSSFVKAETFFTPLVATCGEKERSAKAFQTRVFF
jgi:hypothetical protein